MQITPEARDRFTVLHLRGEFDTYYCPLLQEEVDGLLRAGETRVVLNLRLVKFINSTALGAILKASKALKKAGGGLALSKPSAFVRDIIEKVGLNRVVSIHGSDEDAGAALLAGAPQAAAETPADLPEDESSVLFALLDEKRMQHFVENAKRRATNPLHGHVFGSNWRGIGRMLGLDSQGLSFFWNGGNTDLSSFEMGQLLALGTELRVKFRLPLLKKGLCEAVVAVTEIEERDEGVKVAASFHEIDEETREAVEQWAKDMAFLKSELRQATGDSPSA